LEARQGADGFEALEVVRGVEGLDRDSLGCEPDELVGIALELPTGQLAPFGRCVLRSTLLTHDRSVAGCPRGGEAGALGSARLLPGLARAGLLEGPTRCCDAASADRSRACVEAPLAEVRRPSRRCCRSCPTCSGTPPAATPLRGGRRTPWKKPGSRWPRRSAPIPARWCSPAAAPKPTTSR